MEKDLLNDSEDSRIKRLGVTTTSQGMQASVHPIMNSRFDGRTSKTSFVRVKTGQTETQSDQT